MILTESFWIVDAVRYLLIIFGGVIISGQFSDDIKTYVVVQTIIYFIVSFFFQYALNFAGA